MTWNERLMPVFRDVNKTIQGVAEEAAALMKEACIKAIYEKASTLKQRLAVRGYENQEEANLWQRDIAAYMEAIAAIGAVAVQERK